MSDFVISTCSTADLQKSHFEARDIKYICFHYNLNGVDYPDDLGQSMQFKELYDRMAAGEPTSTSQVNLSEYLEFFESYLKQGKDVIHLCLSSGISGTFNAAQSAALIARERYPERKLYVVDSLCASGGQGLLADKCADLRDEGKTIDEIYEWVEEHKLELHHWFFSTDLTFFVRGGRISKAEGFFGGVLNICPLMNVDFEGHLIPRTKVRGKKKVITEIVDRMEKYAFDGHDYSDKVYITHADSYEDARAVADLIEQKFPKTNGKPLINWIGTTIGSHTGPGTVALFFWGKKRDN